MPELANSITPILQAHQELLGHLETAARHSKSLSPYVAVLFGALVCMTLSWVSLRERVLLIQPRCTLPFM